MVKPHAFITLLGKRIPSFAFFCLIGFVASLCITFSLIHLLHLSIFIWLFQILVEAAVFFGLSKLMNLLKITSVPRYYHHELAIIFLSWIYLWLIDRQHVLQYLDITVVSLGTVLGFGRIGCFMAGCCYGKPAHFGIHYHTEHVYIGLPYYYLRAKLFPIQLIESASVLLIVAFLLCSIIFHQPPGTALILYILCYGLLRFFLEFARGDLNRPYYGRFSEAQWFSIGLSGIILIMSLIGWLPDFTSHRLLIPAWTTIVLVFFFLTKRATNPWLQIKHHQIRKLAILVTNLDLKDSKDSKLKVGENTILVTGGIIKEKNTVVRYFTVSMYPIPQVLWIECVGRMIYALLGCGEDLTILNKNKSMMQFIIRSHQES